MSDSLRPHGLQHAWLSCPSPTLGACSNSCSSSRWCHPTISSSVIPFSSCLQYLPASGSFPMSQFFTSSGQSIGVSASTSVLPMNTQDGFPLGWTGWISLKSKDSQASSPTPQFKSYATLEARNKLLYVSYVLYLDLSIIAIILTNTACFYYFFHKSSSAQKEILSKSLKWEVKNKLLV